MNKIFTLLLLILLISMPALAQSPPWNNILAPTRAVDWSKAGVIGGIPNYTTVYQTLGTSTFGTVGSWLQMGSATVGNTLTGTILQNGFNGSICGSWNTSGTTASLKVGASQGAMGGSITVGATTYPIGTATKSIALTNTANFTIADCTVSGAGKQMMMAGYITEGMPNDSPSGHLYDQVRIGDFSGDIVVLQMNNGSGPGNCYCINIETDSPLRHSGYVTITPGARIYYVLFFNGVSGVAQAAIYDPTTFAQIGATMSVAQGTAANVNDIDIGNDEAGTDTGTTYFENTMWIDSSPAFPLLPTTGLTTAAVNSALASCPAGEVVYIPAGTYTGLGTISWSTSCVLRGAGANLTILQFSSASGNCQTLPLLCIQETGFSSGSSPQNGPVNVTGTVTQGSTTITLASVPNLVVGNPIILDECPEGTSGATCTTGTVTDNGGPLETDLFTTGTAVSPGLAGPYSNQGNAGNGMRTGRTQLQVVTVTQCDGNSTPGHACASGTGITISPGLYDADWSTSKTPQAWWATSPVTKAGVEGLTVDATNIVTNGIVGIAFHNANNSWVKGVTTIDTQAEQVTDTYSDHLTMQRSYHFLTQTYANGSYGYGCFNSSDNLVENNIFQAIASPRIYIGCEGTVFAYNYDTFNFYSTPGGLNQNMAGDHGPGANYNLDEGNIGNQHLSDVVHGTRQFNTDFRNYMFGPSQTCWLSASNTATSYTALSTGTFGACTFALSPVILQSFGRFMNEIGNVLGTTGTNTTYNTTGSQPVYAIGLGSTSSGVTVPPDSNVTTTTMLWANCDPTNGGAGGTPFTTCQYNSGEVPSGISGTQAAFANPVPATHVLPASFYYSSKPAWWPSGKIWPAIGPDVTGGNLSGVNGLANTNPAEDCYNFMGGPSNGVSTSALIFNETTCYSTINPTPAPVGSMFTALPLPSGKVPTVALLAPSPNFVTGQQ